MKRLRRIFDLFVAYFRLDLKTVCRMSAGRPMWYDFHDYPDAAEPPKHFCVYRCQRCHKRFII